MAEVSAVYVPEMWAALGIDILKSRLVLAEIVHRDFENVVSQQGDTINTRKPTQLTVRSWGGQEDTGELADNEIVVERPTAVNVAVVLNNHEYVSFMEEDKTATMSVTSIREQFIEPAIYPLAKRIDTTLFTELDSGTDGSAASIGETQTAGSPLVADDIVDLMKAMDDNDVPDDMRRLVLSTTHRAAALKDSLFVQANQSGSDTALRRAELGSVFGFDTFWSQNVPVHTDGNASYGFHKNALAFVSRPLRQITGQLGVVMSVQQHQGYSARVIVSYKHRGMGVDVSFDALWGTKLLDAGLAQRLLGG
jgi:hypothetical protein